VVEIDSRGVPAGREERLLRVLPADVRVHAYAEPVARQSNVTRYENADKIADVAKAFIRYESNVLVSLLEALPDQRVYDRLHPGPSMNDAIRMIERHDAVVTTMVTNAETALGIMSYDQQFASMMYDAKVWTTDVLLVDDKRLDGKAYFLSQKDWVGAFCVRDGLNYFGWILNETLHYNVGMSILNPPMVSCAHFERSPSPTRAEPQRPRLRRRDKGAMTTYEKFRTRWSISRVSLLFCICAWHAGLLTSREAALASHYEESLFLKMAGRSGGGWVCVVEDWRSPFTTSCWAKK
jgi:hypothetical protein